MDMNLIVTLLTVAVILLSAVIIGLITAVIVVLVKIKQLTKNLNVVLANTAKASEWLAPAKVFQTAFNIFRK